MGRRAIGFRDVQCDAGSIVRRSYAIGENGVVECYHDASTGWTRYAYATYGANPSLDAWSDDFVDGPLVCYPPSDVEWHPITRSLALALTAR